MNESDWETGSGCPMKMMVQAVLEINPSDWASHFHRYK